jgi:hypothetical protein
MQDWIPVEQTEAFRDIVPGDDALIMSPRGQDQTSSNALVTVATTRHNALAGSPEPILSPGLPNDFARSRHQTDTAALLKRHLPWIIAATLVIASWNLYIEPLFWLSLLALIPAILYSIARSIASKKATPSHRGSLQ